MPQQLGIAKSEPLSATPALGIATSEPLPAAATPPPGPSGTPPWKGFGPELWDAAKRLPGTLLRTGDLGMAESTPDQKIMSGESAGAAVGGTLAAGAVAAAAPEVAGVAGLAGVARAIPWAWRVGAGAASVAGAGAGGGAVALGEGKPLMGEDSAMRVAEYQAALQAAGIPVGWLMNAAGRRLLATKVGQNAVEWLTTSRAKHVEEAGLALTQAQDALDAHAKAQATARLADIAEKRALQGSAERTAVVGETEATRLRGQWPQVEGAPPVMAPVAAHAATPPPMQPVPAHQSLEAALRAQEAELHVPRGGAAGPVPVNPDRGPGGMTLRPPSPQNAASIARQMDRRDALLGRSETSAATPPPPLYMSGTRSGPPSPAMAEQLAAAGGAATPPPPMAPVPAHTPGGPSYAAQAAQQAEAVISGPAQTSKERIGAAVEAAAESGPPVKWGPVQARLNAMIAKIQPRVGGGEVAGAVEGAVPTGVEEKIAKMSEADARDYLKFLGIEVDEAHPLPGVLGQIAGVAEDHIPYADAHRFKRLLDDAIGWKPAGAIQAPARGQLKQVTKGIRGDIRASMAGHQPYEQATQAYKAVSTLFAPGGLARKIQAVASTNPEALVTSLVKTNEPTKFRMLKEVLTHHGAEGGGAEGAAAGQQAWAAVQSTVMYQHLIKPGIDNWEKSLAKMDPEFLHTLTEEPHAKAVFDRLASIASAVKASEAQTAAETGVKAAQLAAHGEDVATRKAQAAVEGTALRRGQREAARGVQEARRSPITPHPGEDQIGRMLTNQEDAFAKSSLGNPASTTSQISDLMYATTAPPGSPRQMAGMARLLWKGPKANDLIHWASLSDDNTQMLVRAVSGPNSALAVSNLMRGVEELYRQHAGGPRMAVAHSQTPQAAAATPPPAPRR